MVALFIAKHVGRFYLELITVLWYLFPLDPGNCPAGN